MRVGFWGLEVEPSNSYSQEVDADFQLTMAALSSDAKPHGKSTLLITIDGSTFALCTLVAGKLYQQPLDLTLVEGENVSFSVEGNASVHLTGNYIIDAPFPAGDMEDEGEDEGEDEQEHSQEISEDTLRKLLGMRSSSEAEGDGEEDENEDEGDEDDDEMDEDSLEIESPVATNGKRKVVNGNQKEEAKKVKVEEPKKQQEKSKKQPEKPKQAQATKKGEKQEKPEKQEKLEKLEKQEKKDKPEKKEKKEKKEKLDKQEAKETTESRDAGNKVKKLPSGLSFEDKVVGSGPKARKNHKVAVRYIGRLTDGKVFDSNTKGSPFTFKLGKGEVIKGWDMGIIGMHVGGERKLTIPSYLAYGAKGAPPAIPPNADLEFEVKLLEIK